MTDLTANLPRVYRDPQDRGVYKVAAGEQVWLGMGLQETAAGVVSKFADTAPFAGFADSPADNTNGADGDTRVETIGKCGTEVVVEGSASSTPGTPVYAIDSNRFTVDATGRAQAPAGALGRQISGTTWSVNFIARRNRIDT